LDRFGRGRGDLQDGRADVHRRRSMTLSSRPR